MIKGFLRKSTYVLFGLIGLVILLISVSLTSVDRTPYKETEYYEKMSQRLDSLDLRLPATDGVFKAGWAKVNIVPSFPVDLAGYGVRGPFESVHDSLFVRTFVLDLNGKKVVLLNADILIMPPLVVSALYEKLPAAGFSKDQVYLSATHTHNAPGGWAGGWAGSFVAGKYNQEYCDFLVKQFLTSIQLAAANTEPAQMAYGEWIADQFVRNRLNYADSKIDPWLRCIKFKKNTGKEAILVTYSAHPNCLAIANHSLSRDYTGVLIDSLEQRSGYEFAVFMAGTVGSHSPALKENAKDFAQAQFVGEGLYNIIRTNHQGMKYDSVNKIGMHIIPLELRDPHMKLDKNIRVRPWVFKKLLGDWSCNIKVLQIGNVVMMGMPCDFSGELMPDLEPVAKARNLNLVITSFNGGYIGYINVDKYYDHDRMETRAMNWFGPYNQAYFTEIVQRVIGKTQDPDFKGTGSKERGKI